MLIWILGYLAVAAAIVLWDTYVGYGFEFPPIEDGPNAVVAGALWPIGLPIILLIVVSMTLEKAKKNRLDRSERKHRIRIAAETEEKAIIEQIEEEMQHVEAEGKNQGRSSSSVS